ncbi:hypothetical protein [Candidatus Cyanaurora vandensis]|uniref:hypothetical protein n=1 Tax=Candidatus Cyanaurora vandensis TaxID=2714958 RepID=UPI00257D4EB2|nr:hypothetical protein [Candidatus Cyanaurora vandensis]
MSFLATTAAAELAGNGANLSAFLYFAGLAGLVVAVVVHALAGVLGKERLGSLLMAMVSGVVTTTCITGVTSWVSGTGQLSITQSIVQAAGVTAGPALGLSTQTLERWSQPDGP